MDINIRDERAHQVIFAARFKLGEFGQRFQAVARVVERLTALQGQRVVAGAQLESGGISFGGPRVVLGAFQLTRQTQVSVDLFARACFLRILEGRAKRLDRFVVTAQLGKGDAAVEVAVEALRVQPRDLGKLKQRCGIVAASVLGQPQPKVRVARAVVQTDGFQKAFLCLVEGVFLQQRLAQVHPSVQAARLALHHLAQTRRRLCRRHAAYKGGSHQKKSCQQGAQAA